MAAYYNEIDHFAAAWLRELIKRGLIADGVVDERSIVDVAPEDVREFIQCHFFAGIGGWSYALRLAGWPDDRPIWTGSCPCQPFSTAGRRQVFNDERHLWPHFFRLIRERRPPVVMGEQVASKDALAWCDLVRTDMEGAGYAFGVQDTCAAGFGAPHIRQRLYWVALGDSQNGRYFRRELGDEAGSQCHAFGAGQDEGCGRHDASDDGGADWMAYTLPAGWDQRRAGTGDRPIAGSGESGGLGNNNNTGLEGLSGDGGDQAGRQEPVGQTSDTGYDADTTLPTNGFWRNPDWLWCRDKKWRPVKSGLSPLADGVSKGVVRGRDFRAIRQRLKGYGNAIVAPQAAEIVKAFMEVCDD